MLFKPDLNEAAKKTAVGRVASRARRRTVSIAITLIILGGLGYIAWTSFQQKQAANRGRPDLPVPVLAATPRIQDVPVYLDAVGAVRALNTVTVRSQVDGKLIAVNFTEGQDVKKGDVLGEIDPDIVVVYGTLIIGSKVIAASRKLINLHTGFSPTYRGSGLPSASFRRRCASTRPRG